MGRFIAIVIVLVAVALLVNRLMSVPEPVAPPGAELPELSIENAPAAEPKDQAEPASAGPKATGPKATGPQVTGPQVTGPQVTAQKRSAQQTSAPTDQATGEAGANDAAASDTVASNTAASDTTAAAEAASPGASEEVVLLGSEDLAAGIAGEGSLTVVEIETWLKDPKNHLVLKPQLPLGLAAGARQIKGIDANPLTRAKIELGRQLYFDARLSADSTISCASCHDPDHGYAKDTQFGVGIDGQQGERNSPVAYNRILSGPQFWDGRAESLEAQAVGPIENPIEMGITHDVCVATVKGIEGYQKQFDAIFDDGVTIENVGRAIASFERTIVTGPAPWDHYQQLASFEKAYADDIEDLEELKKDDEELYQEYMELKQASQANPISASAIRGGELFFSDKAGCTACHVGANFTDELYHNLGVGMDAEEPDLGRYSETGDDKDRGAFKTPTVRNVALSAPYMHDGSQKTLEEVVEWYAKGGHPNDHLSEKIKKLTLSDQDKQDLVAFMRAGLSSEFPKVERGRLP